jgi:hypothetical protein
MWAAQEILADEMSLGITSSKAGDGLGQDVP